MHDTAFSLGTLAMNIYADVRSAAILEVGSQAVNGSLRENALPTTKYVGVDLEAGDGVDLVVEPGKPLPLPDESFDLVMASSVFEHDPCFWNTFIEMCRKTKNGGYIYINTPSNGAVHRYPQDNWRFYPDCGKALAQWAVSQGQFITLVESFTAERQADIWNDFVAVFRKGRITKTLPKVFIHEHVPCANVVTWKSKDTLHARAETEDMLIAERAIARARHAEDGLSEALQERDSLAGRLTELGAAAERMQTELNEGRNLLIERLREAERTRDELTRSREELDGALARLAAVEQHSAEMSGRCAAAEEDARRQREQRAQLEGRLAGMNELLEREQARVLELRGDHERSCAAQNDLEKRLKAAEEKRRDAEQRLALHFNETAVLSRKLIDGEQRLLEWQRKIRKTRELYQALLSGPRWWNVLPSGQQSRLQQGRLRRLGLFDGPSYLVSNPDVAQANMEPLLHYLLHGIDEDRQF